MSPRADGVAVVAAASVAEVGSYLALDSALASLAAFGSVLGLGVLHFRSRKTKLAPTPTPPRDPITMPIPASPVPRRDETFIAVADLTTRIDALQRTLDADDGLAQRLDGLRAEVMAIAGALDHRTTRASEEGAQRALALAEACKAVESRVGAAESRLLDHTKRLERALGDTTERASERAQEALARIARDVATLRDDVQRATDGVHALQTAPDAPVLLGDEQASLLQNAADNAAAMARRVASMSERLDAGFEKLAALGAASSNRVREDLEAARGHVESLARDAASLRDASGELRNALAATEARVLKAVRESESRLEITLLALRDEVAALPTPETTDVQPLLAAIERLTGELRATTRTPAPADLAHLLAAMRDAKAEIAGLAASLPAPADLGPVQSSLARVEERLALRLDRVAEAVVKLPSAPDLRPIAATLQELPDEIVARLPAAPAVDLSPLRAAIEELPIDEVTRAVRASEQRLADSLRKLCDDLAEGFEAIPAPAFPLDEIRDALRETEERLARRQSAASSKERASRKEERERLEDALAAIQEAIAQIPRPDEPEPFPLDEISASMRAMEARVSGRVASVREAILALPAPPEPAAFPIDDIRGAVRDAQEAVEGSVASMRHDVLRSHEEHVLALHDAVEDLRADLEARDRRAGALLAASEAATRALHTRVEDLARDVQARWQQAEAAASQREQDLERRIAARIGVLESRLVDELRSLVGRTGVDIPAVASVHYSRPRRHVRASTE